MTIAELLQNEYVQAGIAAGAGFILAIIINFVLKAYMHHIGKKTKTDIDDVIFDKIKKPLFMVSLRREFSPALPSLSHSFLLSYRRKRLRYIAFFP